MSYCFAPGEAYIDLPAGMDPASVRLTNTTFAALSMRDGDAFAKQFGGVSGDDPDWFLLTIDGLDAGGASVGSGRFLSRGLSFRGQRS